MYPRIPRLGGLALGLALPLLLAAPAEAQNSLRSVRVTVNEESQPLRDVLVRLREKFGLNYVYSDAVIREAGPVTVHLEEVVLEDALSAICAACGMDLEIRGEILVIVSRRQRSGQSKPLPRVEAGLEPRDGGRRFQPPPARDLRVAGQEGGGVEKLAALPGTLESVDFEARRVRLRVDGVVRDFYLPSRDDGDVLVKVQRLENALRTLKVGHRTTICYRRSADGKRDLIEAVIGAARPGSGSEQPGFSRPGRVSVADAPKPEPATPQAPLGKEQLLFGVLDELDGDKVTVRDVQGTKVLVYLPTDPSRKRVCDEIKALPRGRRLGVVYELKDGKKVITNAVVSTGD